jgi:O-antigen/teichoic acid export membrane protein
LIEYKLFIHRIGLVGITNILVALSSLILLPILTKSFVAAEYGIWVQITTTIFLFSNLTTLGLPFAMLRFLSAEKNRMKIQEGFYSVLIAVILSSVILLSIFILFSESISNALFNNNLGIVIIVAFTIFFAGLNGVLLGYFRTFQQMKVYSIFVLFQTYSGVFVVSYLAISNFDIYYVTIGLFVTYLFTFALMFLFISNNLRIKIPQFKNLRKYLSFGIPTIPSNFSYWAVDSSDRYIIGFLLGTTFVGYYAPGYILGNIIIILLSPFSFLLPSVLPKYYDKNDIKTVTSFLEYSLKYFLLIAIPSAFGISLLSKPVLILLTTPEIALNGYLITPFVAFSTLLYGVYGIISNILVLEKKTKIIGFIWIIAALVNIILNIIIVPYLGIIGAAITTSISYIAAFSLSYYYSIQFFKININYHFIFKCLIASLLMSVFIIIINPNGILSILCTIMISCVIYFGLIYIFKGITKNEVMYFKKMFKI